MKQLAAGVCAWVGLCSLLAPAGVVRAQTVTQLQLELGAVNEHGPLAPRQGQAVAISADGTRALVGVPAAVGAPFPGPHRGTVLVYARAGGTWTEEARLVPEGDDDNPAFGAGLALSADGSVALIGATSPEGGAAHVFVRDGASWSEQAVLSPAAGQPADLFGFAVALSADGRVALIGAASTDTAVGEAAGRAYVFGEDAGTWTEQSVLEAADAHALEAFGGAVALSADGATALIGAPQSETEAGEVGSARVFIREGDDWQESAKLLAADGVTAAQFGGAVALSADGAIALIGARNDHIDDVQGNPGAGSARVFVRAGQLWSEEAVLRGGTHIAELGTSVALSADGQRALVGAPRQPFPDSSSLDAGAVRVFDRVAGEWIEQLVFRAEDGAAGDRLGFAVGLSADGAHALVGAPDDMREVRAQGSVHALVDQGAGLVPHQVLTAAPEWREEELGLALALTPDGTRALISAPGTHIDGDDDRGQARLFVREGTTWSLEARLQAADGEAGDRFGDAIAIAADGATALIGVPNDNAGQGSVRVFTRTGSTWTESGTMVQVNGRPGNRFGSAVAISADGQRALIGAPGTAQLAFPYRGGSSVFVRTDAGFVHEAYLGGGRDDVLLVGTSVAIDATGKRAVVDMYDVQTDQFVPRVFVRAISTWSLEARLDPSPFGPIAVPAMISAAGDRALIDRTIYSRVSNVWTRQPLAGLGLALAPDGDAAIAGTGPRISTKRHPLLCVRREPDWSCRFLAAGLGSVMSASLAENAGRVLLSNAAYPPHNAAVRILRLEYTVDPCEGDCDDGGVELDAAVSDASWPDAAVIDDGGALADASDLDSGGDGDASVGPEADASDPPHPMAGAGGGVTDGCVVEQPAPPRDDAGCSCRIERAQGASGRGGLGVLLALALIAGRRARRGAVG